MERLRTLLGQMGKTLFFRSGSDPLILSEEKRETRKQQRIEELRISNGLPPLMSFRQDSNVPELSRNIQTDLYKLFIKRNQNEDFFRYKMTMEKMRKKIVNLVESLLMTWRIL